MCQANRLSGEAMEKKVIIIGAGASGFAAAAKLISNGYQNVLILEAEDRIGGRINTISLGENVVDMGGQWCHGEDGNVVYAMAKDKSLLSSNVPKYEQFNFVRSNGEKIPDDLSAKLTKLAGQILDRNDKRDEKRTYNGSLGNYFAEKFYQAMHRDEFSDVSLSLQRDSYDWFHRYRSMYVACDSWYNTSCRKYLEYIDLPGDLLLNWKDKGYRTALDLLQNKIPPRRTDIIDVESKVQMNKEVKKIQYDTVTSSPGRIKIECSDGNEYKCDHLICTVSLGVLKKNHQSWFEPLLPRRKFESIEGMAFGTVNKVYVEFKKPFWADDWEGISFLWERDQLKEINEDPNGDWLKGIIGFYSVSFQPNVLCGWISGEAARQMELVSDVDFKSGVERVLRMFLRDWDGSELKNIIRSTWSSNPHFCGSYSYYSLKSDASGASPSKLAEPMLDSNSKPIIQFAGEATDTHFYSTVHGAIGTGWREAQRIIDLYTNE